jgi:hypothetical protein
MDASGQGVGLSHSRCGIGIGDRTLGTAGEDRQPAEGPMRERLQAECATGLRAATSRSTSTVNRILGRHSGELGTLS